MPEAKGRLVTPVGFDKNSKPISLLLNSDGRLVTIQDETIEEISLSDSSTVTAGTNTSKYLAAPTGYLYQILGMELDSTPVPGATSGSHGFAVFIGNVRLYYGRSNYNENVIYAYGSWWYATTLTLPSAAAAQTLLIKGQMVSETLKIRVMYLNGTNADQTNTRNIYFLVKKIPLVEV